jgi:ABC-type transport system involved in multi-copper enzyme maturation permease subunit
MTAFASVLSDRLSPMLVKEIRQGLRTRVFGLLFMLAQALMMFCVVMQLLAHLKRDSTTFYDGLFWFCIGIPLLFLIPLRGFYALHGELKENTMELVFLSRLSAWRIVAGKWAALWMQALLLLTAVLPYVVVRYFLGSVNLAENVLALGLLVFGSGLLTGAGIALSPIQNRFARGVLIAFGIMGLYALPVILAVASFSGARSLSMEPRLILLWVIFGGLLLLLLFEFGAARIAPVACNHSTRKRILALLLLALMFGIAGAAGDNKMLYVALIFLLPVCLDAMCERPSRVPQVYRPFVRKKWIGRLVGFLFYPGWASGVLYSLLTLGLVFGLIWMQESKSGEILYFFVALIGAMCVPLAFIKWFKPESDKTLIIYFVSQVVLVALTGLAMIFKEVFDWPGLDVLSLVPTSALILSLTSQGEDYWLLPTACVTAVGLVLLGWRMVPVWSAIRRLEQAARPVSAPPAAEPAVLPEPGP